MIIRDENTALTMSLIALEFYGRQWERFESVPNFGGPPLIIGLPSDDLFKDQGRIARRALISLNGWKVRREGRKL